MGKASRAHRPRMMGTGVPFAHPTFNFNYLLSMKLLLDECIDRKFARELVGYEVQTVPQMGWAGVKNGQLLTLAAVEFDVFITVDRNSSFQQNLPQVEIAVISFASTIQSFGRSEASGTRGFSYFSDRR
jgi:hypothetical protein